MKIKVLYITYRDLNKIANPRIANIQEIIKSLSENVDLEVINIKEFEKGKILKIVQRLGMMFLSYFKKEPFQTRFFYDKKTHKRVISEYERLSPNVVIIDTYRLIHYLRGYEGVKIIDQDDLFSRRYSRMLESGNKFFGVADNLPLPQFIISLINSFSKNVLAYETSKLDLLEKKLDQYCDKLVLVSQLEAEYLNSLLRKNIANSIPQFLSSELINKGDLNTLNKDNNTNVKIYFIGNYSMPHNSASLVYVLESLLPPIRKVTHNFEFVVLGPNLNQTIEKKISCLEYVTQKGYVEDYISELNSIDILLTPLLFGSGLKTKVIEAMIYGKPVISNAVGFEGIGIINGFNGVIANTDAELIHATIELIKDSDKRTKIGKQAKDIVKDFYPSTIKKQWMDLIFNE